MPQRVAEVRGQEREHRVVRDVEQQHESHQNQDSLPVRQGGLEGGDCSTCTFFDRAAVFLGLGEHRRVLEPGPQPQRDDAQRERHQERDSPAPGLHGLVSEPDVEQGAQGGPAHRACEGAEFEERPEESAALVGRVLGHEHCCAAVLTAGGEALHQSADEQQQRCCDTDGVERRQHTDRRRGQRHHRDGQDEDLLTTDAVAERAEHDAADGANDERRGQHGERGEQARSPIVRRKEVGGDVDGQVAVHRVVEPLHGVAQCGPADRAMQNFRFVRAECVGTRRISGRRSCRP